MHLALQTEHFPTVLLFQEVLVPVSSKEGGAVPVLSSTHPGKQSYPKDWVNLLT